MNDPRSPAPNGKTSGKTFFREALLTYAHMAVGVLFSVVIVYLALYYTLILPFYGGFTDDTVWNKLKTSVFTAGFALVSVIWLFIVFRKRGYKIGLFAPKYTLAACAAAAAIHAALSAICRGVLFISGAPYFAAWLVSSGGAPLEDGSRVPLGLILAFLVLFDALYAGVILLASWLGARQRQKQRREIIGA